MSEPVEQRSHAGDRAPARDWPGVLLLEVAWEVCNQVGGIYTVVRSKAPEMLARWGDRYCAVGPWMPQKAAVEFEPERPSGWWERLAAALATRGVRAHLGRWLVPGRPRVILLEHALPLAQLDALKHRLWAEQGIESPAGSALIDDALGFGEAVRRLGEIACREWSADETAGAWGARRVLTQFHEWQGSVGLLLLDRAALPLATVFTTHATSLGRYVASSGRDLYEELERIDPDAEAARYGIGCQHQIERRCAARAQALTTVSPITGEECAALLGRKPDAVTPNALNIERYDVGHDFQTLHAQYKERVHLFSMAHFFPSRAFDLDRTLYFFSSGRFEPRNKGFDLCLQAVAGLDAELQRTGLDVTVVLFIVTQRPTRSLEPVALHMRGVLGELRDVAQRMATEVGERLFRRGAAGERVTLDELVDDYWRLRFLRTQHALHADRLPLVCTHVLDDPAGDPLLGQIRALGLRNAPEQRVKIVYHPDFVSSVNPLWGIEYEQFVRGCHLGIFPSAYEPWGYTPLECIALGVPAVTSDLAGFGRHVRERFPAPREWGLEVLPRRGRSFAAAASDLTRILLDFCRLDRRGRIALRNAVAQHAWDFDWSALGRAYHAVHDAVLEGGP
jgi:glycogen(starch) synthase